MADQTRDRISSVHIDGYTRTITFFYHHKPAVRFNKPTYATLNRLVDLTWRGNHKVAYLAPSTTCILNTKDGLKFI